MNAGGQVVPVPARHSTGDVVARHGRLTRIRRPRGEVVRRDTLSRALVSRFAKRGQDSLPQRSSLHRLVDDSRDGS